MTVTTEQPLQLTRHARRQMHARRLSEEALQKVVTYGRVVWTRGARIYALGRKEARRHPGLGLERYEGVQVVATVEGVVLTVYRNRDLRGLRVDKRPRFAKRAG